MTDISMQHKGSLSNNLCLSGRLQDKVPQALHTFHTAGQPFGLTCFLPQCVTGSTGLLWHILSYLSSLAGRHKGDSLCSACIRPHPGTVSSLGSQSQIDKQERLCASKQGCSVRLGLVQHGADNVLGHLTAQTSVSEDGDIPHQRGGDRFMGG